MVDDGKDTKAIRKKSNGRGKVFSWLCLMFLLLVEGILSVDKLSLHPHQCTTTLSPADLLKKAQKWGITPTAFNPCLTQHKPITMSLTRARPLTAIRVIAIPVCIRPICLPKHTVCKPYAPLTPEIKHPSGVMEEPTPPKHPTLTEHPPETVEEPIPPEHPRQPLMRPSGQPPIHPSGQPPMHPSGQPPMHPSGQPLMHPSGQPPMHPPGQPPMHPPGQPPMHPPGQPPMYPPGQPPTHPSGQLPMHPSGQLPMHPSGQPPMHPPMYPPGQPPMYPSGQPPMYPSGQLPFRSQVAPSQQPFQPQPFAPQPLRPQMIPGQQQSFQPQPVTPQTLRPQVPPGLAVQPQPLLPNRPGIAPASVPSTPPPKNMGTPAIPQHAAPSPADQLGKQTTKPRITKPATVTKQTTIPPQQASNKPPTTTPASTPEKTSVALPSSTQHSEEAIKNIATKTGAPKLTTLFKQPMAKPDVPLVIRPRPYSLATTSAPFYLPEKLPEGESPMASQIREHLKKHPPAHEPDEIIAEDLSIKDAKEQ